MAILADSFYYQPIRIDTINTRVFADIVAKEGDANGRGLLVTLTENGLMKDTTGITLNLKWEHTSVGNQGLDNFEAVDLSKGLYKITYPTEMLNRGKVRAFIQIIDSGKLAGIRNIEITVDRGVGDDTAIASSDSFTALAQALIDVNNLESTYAPRLLSAEQQLAENMTTLQGIDRTFGDATFAALADLQTAYPTGDSKRYIVASDGKWYWWNGSAWTAGQVAQAIGIANGSVTYLKTDHIITGKNRFDKSKAVLGYVSGTGAILASPDSYVVPVNVSPSTVYSRTDKVLQVGFYSGESFISHIGYNGAADFTFTTPANCNIAKVTVPAAMLDTYQVELGATKTAFEPFGYQFINQVPIRKIANNAITEQMAVNRLGQLIFGGTVKYLKFDFIAKTRLDCG